MKPEFYSSKKTLPLLLITAFLFISFQAFSQQVARSMSYAGHTIPFWVYRPVGYNPNGQYPLIIFLHGLGERGPADGSQLNSVKGLAIPKYIDNGQIMAFTYNSHTDTFLVLSPQLLSGSNFWDPYYVDAMLSWAHDSLKVDNNRVYLTGLSLGGGGVWRYATTSFANAGKFAAIAPVCGTCSGDWTINGLCDLGQASTAVWAFHGDNDQVVGYGCTVSAINNMNSCTPEPIIEPKMTIYPGQPHEIWDLAYDLGHTWNNPLNLFEWFLSHSRSVNPCDTNTAPIAEAGNSTSITINSHTLSSWGSYDPGGGSITYKWTQKSGPATTIGGDIYATAQLSNLQVGTYVFNLRVTDNCGDYTDDTTVLEVRQLNCDTNTAPIAEAGNNLMINTTSYLLSSWGSYDPGGGSITYQWSNVSGPTTPTISGPTYATAQVTGLINGTYVFKLIVTDECNATDEDNIEVQVNLSGRTRNNITETVAPAQSPLRMYPNPVGDRLYLSFATQPKERVKISVTDLTGRVFIITEIPAALVSKGLDLTRLKPGVYLVQVESDGKKHTQRIVRK